jgi:hypothetical protein
MKVVGQFRDLDDPNSFVWLRSFPDMQTRVRALQAFYGGPVWKEHRAAANATMIDSSNVLLLRPAPSGWGFSVDGNERPARGATRRSTAIVVAVVYHLETAAKDEVPDFFERTLKPVVAEAGASVLGSYATEPSANNFPALPVREGEPVFVWFSGFSSAVAYERHLAALARSRRWRDAASGPLAGFLSRPPEVLRLSPTARSLLRA